MPDKRNNVQGVPEGASIARCPDCGQLAFVVTLSNGTLAMVQPTVVRCIVPDRGLVETGRPLPAEVQTEKVIGGTMSGKYGPPVLVPHVLVCQRAPLCRMLPVPLEGPSEPKAAPEAQDGKREKVVHDLEIDNGKIGTSSRYPKSEDEN